MRINKTQWIVVVSASLAAFAVGTLQSPRRARATSWPWVEAYETAHRVYQIDGGGFTPGHLVVVGAFRPAPGPPPVPYTSGSTHWFAGHKAVYANSYGEISTSYTVTTSTPCDRMLPFIACDNNEVGNNVIGCLNWNGPIGSDDAVSPDPSYNYLTCP
jgi:hypothetical protein